MIKMFFRGGNMFGKRFLKWALLVVVLVVAVTGAERVTLVELFTNTGCGPCLSHNLYLDWYHPEYEHLFTLIRTHVHWPSAADPFYQRNTSQAYALYNTLYGVTAVPDARVDGDDEVPSAANVEAAQAIPSPCTIDLSLNRSTNTATAVVNTETPYSGSDLRLFFVLTEDNISFVAPNGQTIFHETMREYFPNTTGTSISLSSTGTQTFNQVYDFGFADEEENCRIVAYIQDRGSSSLPVIQSAQEYVAQYGFRVFPSAGRIANSTSAVFSSSRDFTVYNNHSGTDNYTVTVTTDMPTGWTISPSVDGTPFSTSHTFSIAGESDKDIDIGFDCHGVPGIGTVDIEVDGTNAGYSKTTSLQIYAGGNVLIVDDDGGADYEDYYIQAVLDAGFFPCVHDYNIESTPSSSFLGDYAAVVWLTGDQYSSVITAQDEVVLQTYLNGGGRLFISGQEVGYDIGGGDGGTTSAFYTNYLKASFAGDDASYLTCAGISGDPVSDGFSIGISGGDGADNQDYPDYITTTGGSTNCMYYGSSSSGQIAGIKYDGTYRMVYFGFGFEAINNATDRGNLMYNILTWFGVTMGTNESPYMPEDFRLVMNPNPFNGALKIDVLPGTDVQIYDMHGRLVGKPDIDNVWRPESGVSSGIYLVRATRGNKTEIRKAVYLK